MISNTDLQNIKLQALNEIRSVLFRYKERLNYIDNRIWKYANDLVRNDIDIHNVDEILSFRKFLRCIDTYTFDYDKVHLVYRAYELLKFSGLYGKRHYSLTPIQCFMLAGVFGFIKDGKRLVRDATFFIPRKFCKTTMGAFFQFWFFYFEDANSEGYCVANSQDQSKILYNLAYDFIHQLDPNEKRIRFTATEINWRLGQAREASVVALSAGGKTKDGLFAQLVTADEYGSAGYVKDHCDMSNLLQTVRGSMGPRLEPLVLTTTTAGRVSEGPFELRLRELQKYLFQQLTIPLDGYAHETDDDWIFLISLHPDQWELDEESLQESRVWRKCNPHLGITVQSDYYKNEWKAMLLDEETKREQLCKLFNIFQSDRRKEWISAEYIRKLQSNRTIDNINSDDGWVCFAALDCSKGDDLNALSYLCYNQKTGAFFADMDAWISEESLRSNTNSALYKLWKEQGWLKVSPGATINEMLILERLQEISEHLTIIKIGYDAYDAKRFINAIAAWIHSENIDPDSILRPVSQQFATYNGVVQEMDYMIKNNPPLIEFSANPMWPWEFGNCLLALSSDGMENVKPIKSGPNNKVDNVQALLSALHLFDEMEGQKI